LLYFHEFTFYFRKFPIHRDYESQKLPDNIQYFDFAICEYDQKEKGEIIGKIVNERLFFKNYNSACEFFNKIEFIDYFCFQYEQGESGNKHLQGFLHFNRPMDFNIVRDLFPTMHLDDCKGKNSECIDYCSKPDTRIDGYPFYQSGVVPADECTRTDVGHWKDQIVNNAPLSEMLEDHPYLTVANLPKIKQLRQELLWEKFGNVVRDITVTYICGDTRLGKSTFPNRVLGYAPNKVYRFK
jgi:hypothetical protein